MERDQGFVDRAVVAPLKDHNLGAAGNLARETNRETVGVGRGERELPVGQAETPLQFFADEDRILGGQHEGDAAFDLIFDGLDRREGGMSGHGSGVAEAEVDVTMAVDVVEVGALSLTHDRRKRPGPLYHPVHGDAR
ncbi:MAG: hypothetical protein ABSD75_09330 [Terriglobales bacterium]|jgi:hypothetical protein